MVEAVVARHGTVDILVNCAGTAKRAPALEQAEADWEYMIELNLKGTAWACRAVAPVMRRAGRGRIVNITSIGAEFGLVNRAAYCATKGGVAQLTRCLALEWGPHGITVNAVGPGITVTPLVRPFLDANPGKEETMTRKIPLGRLGRPGGHGGRRRLPGVRPGRVHHRADHLRRRRVGRWRPRLVSRPRATAGPLSAAIPLGHTESVRKTLGESDVVPLRRHHGRLLGRPRRRGVRQEHPVRRPDRPRRPPWSASSPR